MTDTSSGAAPAGAAGSGQQTQPPSLSVLGQYIKDFSFENPKAPDALRARDKGPNIGINVNVSSRKMTDTEYEVELKLDVTAKREDDVVFRADLVYAGLFRIANVQPQHLQPFVLIECPRLLFPFARQILAEATRNGGFPPLLIDPIDFVSLYQQHVQAAQRRREAEADGQAQPAAIQPGQQPN